MRTSRAQVGTGMGRLLHYRISLASWPLPSGGGSAPALRRGHELCPGTAQRFTAPRSSHPGVRSSREGPLAGVALVSAPQRLVRKGPGCPRPPRRWAGPAARVCGSPRLVPLPLSSAQGSFSSELPGPGYGRQSAREVGGSPVPTAPHEKTKLLLRGQQSRVHAARGSGGGGPLVFRVRCLHLVGAASQQQLSSHFRPHPPDEAGTQVQGCRRTLIWGLVPSFSAPLCCGHLWRGCSPAEGRLRKADGPSLRASRPHQEPRADWTSFGQFCSASCGAPQE